MIEYFFLYVDPDDDVEHPTYRNVVRVEGACSEPEFDALYLMWKSDPRAIGAAWGSMLPNNPDNNKNDEDNKKDVE